MNATATSDWPAPTVLDPGEIPALAPAPRRTRRFPWMAAALFVIAHVPLGVAIQMVPALGVLHSLFVLGVGAWWALQGVRVERVAYVAAYIVGAEVLWRMTKTGVFWEFGKYAAGLIFVLSMMRRNRLRLQPMVFAYFLLLVPGALITLTEQRWRVARELLSSDMSAPLLLCLGASFFSGIQLKREHLLRLCLALAAPVLAVAAVAIRSTVTAEDLVFTGNSNFVTSGGFGPNQVSSMLGLGALAAFFALLHEQSNLKLRTVLLGVMIVLLGQSAMTFSRTGLYLAGAAVIVASLIFLRDPRVRRRLVVLFAVLGAAAVLVVVPFLDSFTHGSLTDRFKNTGATNRDNIVKADVELWKRHPVFGVGTGQSRLYRHRYRLAGGMAHTEFSRLIAEHGGFGLVSCIIMIAMGVRNVRRVRFPAYKAFLAATAVWSYFFMLSTGTRLLAPMFLLALGFATLLLDPPPQKPPPREDAPDRDATALAPA